MAARAYWMSPRVLAQVRGHVLILTYHRVVPRREPAVTFVQPGMYVTPETFERHLRFLMTHFTIFSFEDLLARWRDDALDPSERYCTITFDDGWLDNYVHAFPILRAYDVPATIFLTTDLIGTNDSLWSDRLGDLLYGWHHSDAIDALIERAKELSDEARSELIDSLLASRGARRPKVRRFLNWNESREMSRHRIAFGSHTCTHPALSRLHGEALRRELQRPLEVLREQRVNAVPVLSYPYGDHSDQVVAEAKAVGYCAAVSTHPGPEAARPADRFRLKRIEVHEDVTSSVPLLSLHIARQARAAAAAR